MAVKSQGSLTLLQLPRHSIPWDSLQRSVTRSQRKDCGIPKEVRPCQGFDVWAKALMSQVALKQNRFPSRIALRHKPPYTSEALGNVGYVLWP